MKRIICILTAVICCICSIAAGETHIGIQGTIVSEESGKTVLFDLFRNNDNTVMITSTLTPDYAIRNQEDIQNIYGSAEMFFGITPGSIESFISEMDATYHEWLKTRYHRFSEGIYTGSFFRRASTVYSTEYMLSDLIQYFKNSSYTESGTENRNIFRECIIHFADNLAAEYNPLVRMKSYDSDSYINLEFVEKDQVIMTIAFDNTKENEKRILITQKETGRYYFRDIYIQYNNGESSILTNLYSSGQALYDNISQEELLFSEYFALTGSKQPYSMTYHCGTQKTGELLSVKGSVGPDEIRAGIFLQESQKENIVFSAVKDNETPAINPDQMKILNNNNLSESNEYRIAFMSGASLFLVEIIPMLPVSSQKLLYQIIFEH